MEITIRCSVKAVLEEVERKTAYQGAKKQDDEGAFERIGTIDEDQPELMSHFYECQIEIAERLNDILGHEGPSDTDSDEYDLVLNVDDTFNRAVIPSLDKALHYFFVYGIITRWYMITNKEEAAAFAQQSAGMLDTIYSRAITRTLERKMRPF